MISVTPNTLKKSVWCHFYCSLYFFILKNIIVKNQWWAYNHLLLLFIIEKKIYAHRAPAVYSCLLFRFFGTQCTVVFLHLLKKLHLFIFFSKYSTMKKKNQNLGTSSTTKTYVCTKVTLIWDWMEWIILKSFLKITVFSFNLFFPLFPTWANLILYMWW